MSKRKFNNKPKPDMNVNGEFKGKEPNKPTKILTKESIKEKLKKL